MSVATINVLITSAGRRVALVECFRRAAAKRGWSLQILACDLEPELSAACHAADCSFAVPPCDDPAYVDTIFEAARQNGITLVVPTIDPELIVFSRSAERFAAAGIRVHVSPSDVTEIARDKLLTSQVLSRSGVQVPWTEDVEAVRTSGTPLTWPLMLKPKSGSASRGIAVVRSFDQLPLSPSEPMILQELLVGPEFTTNIFIDADGTLRSAVPHRRIRVRAGEVEKGRTERRSDLEEIAYGVASALPSARGALCFQTILDRERGMTVFEINARFGGGYPLADHAGAEFALWLLEEAKGAPCSAHNNWREHVTMLRYDAAVFHG